MDNHHASMLLVVHNVGQTSCLCCATVSSRHGLTNWVEIEYWVGRAAWCSSGPAATNAKLKRLHRSPLRFVGVRLGIYALNGERAAREEWAS